MDMLRYGSKSHQSYQYIADAHGARLTQENNYMNYQPISQSTIPAIDKATVIQRSTAVWRRQSTYAGVELFLEQLINDVA